MLIRDEVEDLWHSNLFVVYSTAHVGWPGCSHISEENAPSFRLWHIEMFSDMPHGDGCCCGIDFCYQKWAWLDDDRRQSSQSFMVRSGVTGNCPQEIQLISCCFIWAGCWAAAGSSLSGSSLVLRRLWGFQLLSQWNTLKTRLIWRRTLQDRQPHPSCLK